MKHTGVVTAILIGIFVASQLIGLALLAAASAVTLNEDGTTTLSYEDTALGARPDTVGFGSFAYLIIGIALGTAVLLLLVRFKLVNIWRVWFFIAVTLAMTVAIGALMNAWVAFLVALGLAYWKIFKPNMLVHNITEVLVYAGIALLIVPIFDVWYASLLFIVIAAYDAYAVWRSKHMVRMAEFQTDSKLFAGLTVPYGVEKKSVAPKSAKRSTAKQSSMKNAPDGRRIAILGGGDIAFPLLYAGVIFNSLLVAGMSKVAAYSYSLIIVAGAAIGLTALFLLAKKDKFYPAIPFLAAGCFVAYGVLQLFV
jgi:presenilin-like A22 family membrane protease